MKVKTRTRAAAVWQRTAEVKSWQAGQRFRQACCRGGRRWRSRRRLRRMRMASGDHGEESLTEKSADV
eukprot:4508492-Karenia_brevis.AAC.1